MITEDNFEELYEESEKLELRIKEDSKRLKEIKDMMILFLGSKNTDKYEKDDYVVRVASYVRKGPISEEKLIAEGVNIDLYRKPEIQVTRLLFQRITDM